MYEKFGQFINGKWQKSENNETYDVINSATEEIIGAGESSGTAGCSSARRRSESTELIDEIALNKNNVFSSSRVTNVRL